MFSIIVVHFLVVQSYGFTVLPHHRIPKTDKSISYNSMFSRMYLSEKEKEFSGRYWQLEELEDREASRTEIFLSEDKTVKVGMTDGPLPDSIKGTWSIDDENETFEMTIERKYQAGQTNAKDPTAIGEFSFSVSRTYKGELTQVGGYNAVMGSMEIPHDTWGKVDCGYFNIIDTSEEREKWNVSSELEQEQQDEENQEEAREYREAV